jgi:hypothetical protein
MVNKSYVCVNGKILDEIQLTSAPTQGKKIMVEGEPLVIRCALRYIDIENDIKNVYIDLIDENDSNDNK